MISSFLILPELIFFLISFGRTIDFFSHIGFSDFVLFSCEETSLDSY